MSLDDKTIGSTVRQYRIAGRWSQAQLADALNAVGFPNIQQVVISRIEAGDRALRYTEAVALARVLGIALDAFTSGDPEPVDAYQAGYAAALRDLSQRLALEAATV